VHGRHFNRQELLVTGQPVFLPQSDTHNTVDDDAAFGQSFLGKASEVVKEHMQLLLLWSTYLTVHSPERRVGQRFVPGQVLVNLVESTQKHVSEQGRHELAVQSQLLAHALPQDG